ncbi:hypothetical protein L21SP3_00968 [Sedimentisphaera cyanobacteriorum]|uniref:Uncharacterized protein n=1 Tax=Sedimentisphaera cyanobacteriorum TaxID=1940790 RepID=A0A1Q2HNX3_9BACT|nr:hypothetical protein [Sedimentisphaera cyanobacteriorum]AQQ09168.1 hypothetical protein L21SP3_00968 [Sedimentisphaera cyanobacteriorum]
MLNKIEYLVYLFRNKVRIFLEKKLIKSKIKIKKYAGVNILNRKEGNNLISRSIIEGNPFFAGRYGTVETNIVKQCIEQEFNFRSSYSDALINSARINAGIFDANPRVLDNFTDLMIDSTKKADLIGVLRTSQEDYILKKYAEAEIAELVSLEPYYHNFPWSKNLKGKKVLVIHPFEQTIINQYKKRQNLFNNPDILPDFELLTIKAVQTIAGEKSEFKDWFEALEHMKYNVNNTDFDVAIIGCGAYGFPLAAHVKSLGKQAIHMGGATQILFGIKGGRWENSSVISHQFNENWVYPLAEEKPKNYKKIENGCYW